MKYTSPIIGRGSGSIGGATFSHNRGGSYIRARVIPVNVNSPAQIKVRALMAMLANRFTNTLTEAQRDLWALYSANVEMPGPLGNNRNVGAMGMFVRSNLARVQSGEATVDVAPAIFDLGSFTPINAPTAVAGTQTVGFEFDDTDDWVNETDASMLVYIGRPVNPAVNHFTGPFRFAGAVDGDDTLPETSPASIVSLTPWSVGQKINFRVQVTRADGRYSNTQQVAVVST